MRNAFIVSYDIADPKRLRKIHKTMLGWGEHIQLSVFCCELSARDRVRMMAKLAPIINHDEDQILIFNIGPAPGRSDRAVEALGLPFEPRDRSAIVV